ncbi:TetR/AcrR family transcriptional regulator [Amycolatopsis sp. H20-H5]|uniref:TetR/AcrR family transcriptional regulator n=1 Tax=Amycolatopsis sp. H20-H5 TaxID=3046309 RepID=UPI002DB80A67|nr:TetR/AcrR family transcriptional regulator [Amycolatopsis sp. H20-H5]MEC3977437.1 TetR/AcrR family transcriptional regulator [Amycolatopsis sp. H20-H5]
MKSTRATARRYGGKTAEQRSAERRGSLIDAALQLWRDQSWTAVTMRGVCARAGLTDRYFYENFTDRDALLGTVWDQVRDETFAMLLTTIHALSERPPLEQLRAALTAVVHHIADEPEQAQILFGDHTGSAVLEQRRHDVIQLATDLLITLARPYLRPQIDENEFRTNVLLGIGGFVQVVFAWRAGLVEAETEAIVEYLAGVAEALSPRFLRHNAL